MDTDGWNKRNGTKHCHEAVMVTASTLYHKQPILHIDYLSILVLE